MLVAVTVYTVNGEITVGVPPITPVLSIVRPLGRVGLTDQDTTSPPLLVAAIPFTGVLTVPTMSEVV